MKRTKNKILFLVFQMFTLLTFASCSYRAQEYFLDKNVPSTNPDTSFAEEPMLLNFETVMKKVIEPKCLKCHGADSPTNVTLINFSDLTTFAENIRIAVESGDMPRKDKLSVEQKKLILDWIQAGLPK